MKTLLPQMVIQVHTHYCSTGSLEAITTWPVY